MKRLLIFLILLTGSIYFGVQLKHDPGYLLIAYQAKTIEMPLWFGFVVMLLVFCLFYALIRILLFFARLGEKFFFKRDQNRIRRSIHLTHQGLIQSAEGYWKIAEKNLLRGAKYSKTPVINYLAAARAAQEQGAYARRDEYLKIAYQRAPHAKEAISMTSAQLQLNQQQHEQSLTTLHQLRDFAPKNIHTLKLLQQTYVELKEWQKLAALLPEIEKRHLLEPQKLNDLAIRTYSELLRGSAQSNNIATAHQLWRHIPRKYHNNVLLIADYAKILIANHEDAEALSLLRDALKHNFDDELIILYGLTKSTKPNKQLEIAEKWLETHKNNPNLLLTLGRLCARMQLWGKARSYLSASLGSANKPETYAELAQLLERLGEHALASDYYRQGLMVSLN